MSGTRAHGHGLGRRPLAADRVRPANRAPARLREPRASTMVAGSARPEPIALRGVVGRLSQSTIDARTFSRWLAVYSVLPAILRGNPDSTPDRAFGPWSGATRCLGSLTFYIHCRPRRPTGAQCIACQPCRADDARRRRRRAPRSDRRPDHRDHPRGIVGRDRPRT
jgi:hypothetical protein